MKEEPDHADSSLTETMAARLEIEQLGDAVRQKAIIEAVAALDGVSEAKIEKGALHVSFDPLATTQKKIEQAVRNTGNTVTTASADTETPHPDLPTPSMETRLPVENANDGERSYLSSENAVRGRVDLSRRPQPRGCRKSPRPPASLSES